MTINEKDGKIEIKDVAESRYTDKGKRSDEFPYKRFVLCPECRRPLLGSISTGRSGKKYPAYHCSKRGHSFRISKQELEETVDDFIGKLRLSPKRVDRLYKALESSWQQAEAQHKSKLSDLDARILNLRNEITLTIQKLKIISNVTAIKYMEKDLARLEQAIGQLERQKQLLSEEKPRDVKAICGKVRHMVEHMGQMLGQQIQPTKKAQLFGLFFDRLPTYADLKGGTAKKSVFTGVNALFSPRSENLYQMEGPPGI